MLISFYMRSNFEANPVAINKWSLKLGGCIDDGREIVSEGAKVDGIVIGRGGGSRSLNEKLETSLQNLTKKRRGKLDFSN